MTCCGVNRCSVPCGNNLSIATVRSSLLDLFKYLAIIAIVLRHTSLGAGGTLRGLGADWVFPHAYIAVEFFFVFAGFSLTAHASREPQEDSLCYVLQKWRRYLPVHLICLALLLAAALNFTLEPYWYLKALQDNPDLLLEALMLHRVGATDFILNNPDWFLSALLVACPLVHVLVKIAIKKEALSNYRALALLLSICCYALVIRGHGSLGAYNTPLWGFSDLCLVRALGGVLLGSAVYLYARNDKRNSNGNGAEHRGRSALLRSTLRECLCLTLFLILLYLPQGGAAADLLSALLFAWIVAVLSRKPQGMLSYLASMAPLRVLYRTQLALYLCHWLFTHYYPKLSGLYSSIGERTLLNTLLLSMGLAIIIEYGKLACSVLYRRAMTFRHNSTQAVTSGTGPADAVSGTAVATGTVAATDVRPATTFKTATAATNADSTTGEDFTVAAKVSSSTAGASAVTVEPAVVETTSVGAAPSASAPQLATGVLISQIIKQANKYLTPPRHDFHLPVSLAVICSVQTALRTLRRYGRHLFTALTPLSRHSLPLRLSLLISSPRLLTIFFSGWLVPWARSTGSACHSARRCYLSARCRFCPGSAGEVGGTARNILPRALLNRRRALRISSASALFS